MTAKAEIGDETDIVREMQAALKERAFVSLAEAARATQVPLTTLSSAVRSGRLPAVRVMPKRWLVRVSAVNSYFSRTDTVISQEALDRFLMDAGILEKREKPFGKPKAFKPLKISGGKSATAMVIEGRQRIK